MRQIVADFPASPELRHWDFNQVRRWGPSVPERVAGSARLRRWQLLCRVVCVALGDLETCGLDRIPAAGPVILAVNHTSAMDGALLFGAVQRPVTFLVKAEAFEAAAGLAGRVLIHGGQLPVRRGRLDPGPVRLALELLEQGALIGIFPEGFRGDGLVRQARPGVGYLALKTGAPVLPVAVHQSGAMAHRAAARRPDVSLTVGEPMTFERAATGPLNRRRWLAATEQIRARLAALVHTTRPNTAVATAR